MRTSPEADAVLREWADEALVQRIEEARDAGQQDRVSFLQFQRLANALRGFRFGKGRRT